MLYEYLVLSRNYSLSVLILLIYLIYFREKKIIVRAIVLGVLANTHFFAAILATVLFIYELKPSFRDLSFKNKDRLGGIITYLIFIALLGLQLQNSQDHMILVQYNNWTFFERLKKVVALIFEAFIIIPDFSSIHFWNSVWLFKISKIFAILSVPAFFFPLIYLKNKNIRIGYYVTILLISLVMFSIDSRIAARYACFIFICFIAFYWVQKTEYINETNQSSLSKYALKLLLIIHVISGMTAVYFDYKYPFSQSKNVAQYILQSKYNALPVIIHPYSSAVSVSAYLGRPYYSLVTESMASFCKWETNPFMISNDTFYQRLNNYMANKKQDVLLVRNKFSKNDTFYENEITNNRFYENKNMKIEFLKIFEPAVPSNEEYVLYRVVYKDEDLMDD